MSAIKTLFLTIIFTLFTTNAMASKLTGINFEASEASTGRVILNFDSSNFEPPEMEIKDKVIQLALPGTVVWPKMTKKVSVVEKFDTTLLGYQYNKDVARFRVMLPYNLKGMEGRVNVTLKNNNIVLDFPKLNVTGRKPAVKKNTTAAVKGKESYDESYLEKLLKDKESIPEVKIKKTENTTTPPAAKHVESFLKAKSDEVKLSQAAGKKDNKFSLVGYIGKFVAFLAMILLFFYGAVTLMKKGVFKKGKLGFLNSTKVVEVLNSTYIAPKRSVMLIRAHNQVFLVGSSEKGLHQLGELNDTAGLLKTGEKELTGNNFDSDLGTANETGKEFKLKDFLNESDQSETSAAEKAAIQTKDSVKLSDQIKKKVKNLKPLQQ